MRRYMLNMVVAAFALGAPMPAPLSSSATAVSAAATDLLHVPLQDRPYQRYFWLPMEEKERDEFLIVYTVHWNLFNRKAFPVLPYRVSADTVRLDLRRLGLEKKLDVFEKFAGLDIFFHVKAKLYQKRVFLIAWPGGKWPVDGKKYDASISPVEFRAGTSIDMAAPWISSVPLVDREGKVVLSKDGKGTSAIDFLRNECFTETPVLNAHWVMIQQMRQVSIRNVEEGVGYSDFLGIKSRDDFFDLTGTDSKVATKVFARWKESVQKSGVSQQNRQIVAFGAANRRVWGTLDTFTQVKRGVAPRNLREGEFAHDAEEWYGFNGVGLPITALFDKNGVPQASAPDKIGGDTSSLRSGRDTRIHVNLSCWRCHGLDKDNLKPVAGWARRVFRQGGVIRLQDKKVDIIDELSADYLRDMDVLLDDDRALYVRGMLNLTLLLTSKMKPPQPGWSIPKFTRAYAKWWDLYVETPVTIEMAARELGISPKQWIDNMILYQKAAGKEDLVLVDHLDKPPVPFSRLDWESSYAFAQVIGRRMYPPEEIKKVKALPAP